MGILKVALRELKYIIRNKRMLVVIFMIPLLYMILFGLMYSTHVVKDIKTVVLDYNNTATSRAIAQGFRDSEKFDVVGQVASETELRSEMENRKITAGIVIPADLDAKIKTGEGSTVLVIVNGTNLLFSNAVLSAANEIVGTFSAGASIKALESGAGLLPDQAASAALPARLALRIWYNPTFNYANFLLLGLAGTVAQQIALLYVASALSREKSLGTINELRPYNAIEVVLGKLTVHFLLNMLSANLVYYLCISYFQVPYHGSIWTFELLISVFLLTIMSLGVMLSIICKNELEATQLAMLFAVPSFLISGFTWPLQAMPDFVQMISKVLPLTYFVSEVRDLALMGISLEQVLPNIWTLLKMTAVFLPVAIGLVHRQLKKEFRQVEEKFTEIAG
ncbi:ABC transporter permease [Desulfosporosinus shakirovi]|uniref:ABC transporter permease n=1 Tax=Desulfosporosinus shakirovi TaxID=2885154 RepID=UPI001E57AE87|nr:ABC transporter permease [Desulfosporosinus sp. SRJS8]MCB8818072.1 ABC transporter permease [Desulfosporosinus sp. SRJS8]